MISPNNQLKFGLFLPAVMLLLSSCASLTKSQLTEVNQFGLITSNFSEYPGRVVRTYNNIQEQQQLFLVNSVIDPDKHISGIEEAYRFKKSSTLITNQMDLVFQIMDDYAQKLVHLTADSHALSLDTASLGLGTNLDNLIGQYNTLAPQHTLPTGIGAAFAKAIQLGGDLYIRSKQADVVKDFVMRGDVLIGGLTLSLEDFLENDSNGGLKSRIIQERDFMKKNYGQFLARNREKIILVKGRDTAYTGNLEAWRSATLEGDQLYLRLLEASDKNEELRSKCLEAVKNLRKAHQQILQDLQQKKKLTRIAADLQYYANDLKAMNSTIKAIKL